MSLVIIEPRPGYFAHSPVESGIGLTPGSLRQSFIYSTGLTLNSIVSKSDLLAYYAYLLK